MPDLRLVGVHEDGEHLLLSDAEGERYLLPVDDALRAAVRRDRPHLGQLQIEIEGGLRPREVQARIRAGATAEEVAALAGWPVEKVRRYEGPVLAERAHIADIAREVRLRRRGGSVTLGAEVSRRLMARGVDLDHVRWDSWRVDGDPWTVVVTFSAGGRERSARWHLDLAGRSVTPGDDEARWLSEDQPDGEGPLAGARLTAVPMAPVTGSSSSSQVYDVEVDGGIGRSASGSGSGTGSTGTGEALDLVSAMRARRNAGRSRRRSHDGGDSEPAGGLHPAGRRRPRAGSTSAPEPLELDPSLMDDPPAAHPPAGIAAPAPESRAPESTATQTSGPGSDVTPFPSATSVSPLGVPLTPVPASPADASPASSDAATTGSATTGSAATPGSGDDATGQSAQRASGPEPGTTSLSATSPRHWPLAEAMRRSPAPALLPTPPIEVDLSEPTRSSTDAPQRSTSTAAGGDEASGPSGRHRHDGDTDANQARSTRPTSSRRKRSSVPSWDDIMFGTRSD